LTRRAPAVPRSHDGRVEGDGMLTGAFTRLVTHLTFKVVDIPAVASAVGQVASALVAIPVAVLAYFAYQISKNSAEATTALTNIERVRLQGELHPRLARVIHGDHRDLPFAGV
jgi:threonine/homoserine/homoserine lactone efflux protein